MRFHGNEHFLGTSDCKNGALNVPSTATGSIHNFCGQSTSTTSYFVEMPGEISTFSSGTGSDKGFKAHFQLGNYYPALCLFVASIQ